MKKLIILTMILCALTQSVWGKECLNKEALELAKSMEYGDPDQLAAQMLIYEGRLNGDFLGLLKEFKKRDDAGVFDQLKRDLSMEVSLASLFSLLLSPDDNNIKDNASFFEKCFGPKWGNVAFKNHNKNGDYRDRLGKALHSDRYVELLRSVDENGCLI